MGIARCKRWLISTLVLALSGGGALPALAGEDLSLRYSAYWGGFHAGDMVLTLEDGNGRYHSDFVMQSPGGVLGWLASFRIDIGNDGRLGKAEAPSPLRYSMHSLSTERERLLDVAFDPASGRAEKLRDDIIAVFDKDADDNDLPPPVPPDLRQGVVDPLSALLQIRARVTAALAGGAKSFTVPTYDGRRRLDLAVEIQGPGSHEILSRRYDTIDLRVTMKAVAGFRPRHQKLWNGAVFDVFLDRASLLPVRLASDSLVASSVINLVETCPPKPGCALPKLKLPPSSLPAGQLSSGMPDPPAFDMK